MATAHATGAHILSTRLLNLLRPTPHFRSSSEPIAPGSSITLPTLAADAVSYFSVAIPPACALHVGVSRAAGTTVGNPDIHLSANTPFVNVSNRNSLQCPAGPSPCWDANQTDGAVADTISFSAADTAALLAPVVYLAVAAAPSSSPSSPSSPPVASAGTFQLSVSCAACAANCTTCTSAAAGACTACDAGFRLMPGSGSANTGTCESTVCALRSSCSSCTGSLRFFSTDNTCFSSSTDHLFLHPRHGAISISIFLYNFQFIISSHLISCLCESFNLPLCYCLSAARSLRSHAELWLVHCHRAGTSHMEAIIATENCEDANHDCIFSKSSDILFSGRFSAMLFYWVDFQRCFFTLSQNKVNIFFLKIPIFSTLIFHLICHRASPHSVCLVHPARPVRRRPPRVRPRGPRRHRVRRRNRFRSAIRGERGDDG